MSTNKTRQFSQEVGLNQAEEDERNGSWQQKKKKKALFSHRQWWVKGFPTHAFPLFTLKKCLSPARVLEKNNRGNFTRCVLAPSDLADFHNPDLSSQPFHSERKALDVEDMKRCALSVV